MSRCWGSHAICLIKETKHEFLLYYHLDMFVGNQTLFSAFSSTVWQILHFEEAIDLIRMRLVWVLSLFFLFCCSTLSLIEDTPKWTIKTIVVHFLWTVGVLRVVQSDTMHGKTVSVQ